MVDFHGGHEGPQKGQKYHIWSVVRVSTGGVAAGETPLRGFWSHYRVVSKSISSHSFDIFEKFFSGIDRPEHSAQKSVSVALAR